MPIQQRHPGQSPMTCSSRSISLLLLVGVTVLPGCSPYYGDLADHSQRAFDRAVAAKAAGDTSGACATMADAAARDGHPVLLIQHARCLMDAEGDAPDLAGARAALERAYAMRSRLKGRAALWLGILERQSGGSPAAQLAWLERARQLGEPGTERLLLKAWAQDPQTYRAQLIAAHERTAGSDPYSALELARLVASDPVDHIQDSRNALRLASMHGRFCTSRSATGRPGSTSGPLCPALYTRQRSRSATPNGKCGPEQAGYARGGAQGRQA
jgi:hypothetical protein